MRARRADRDGNVIDIEGINAPREPVGRVLMPPRTKRVLDQARNQKKEETMIKTMKATGNYSPPCS